MPSAEKSNVAPSQQRLDPLLQQRKILRADRQSCELRLRQHGVHAHQRLILLHDLTLLHQDLIDDASLEMLHGANLRHRYELAMGQRELADGGHCCPQSYHRSQHDDDPHRFSANTKASLLLELDWRRQPIGCFRWARRFLGLFVVRFMTSQPTCAASA